MLVSTQYLSTQSSHTIWNASASRANEFTYIPLESSTTKKTEQIASITLMRVDFDHPILTTAKEALSTCALLKSPS